MFNLLKEYILLEIKEASFQDILDQIISSNKKKIKNNPDAPQKNAKPNPVKSDLETLEDMGKTYNRFQNDYK